MSDQRPTPERLRRALVLVPDVVGLAGFVALLVGVHQLLGGAWTLLVAGGLVFAGYVWREVRQALYGRRKHGAPR